jgi:ligand-binding sensor domain-containing protein
MFRTRSLLAFFFALVVLVASIWSVPFASAFAPQSTQWRSFTARDGLITNSVRSIVQSSDGAYWIGTKQGVSRFDGFWKNYPIGEVLSLWPDLDGTVWCGKTDGLYHFDGKEWKQVPFPDGKSHPVYAVWESKDKRIWIGTEVGIWALDTEVWSRPGNGAPSLPIYSITGSGQAVWAGGAGGLYSYRTHQWVKEEIPGLPSGAVVHSILIAKDGTIWITLNKNIVFYKKEAGWSSITLPGMPTDRSVWKAAQGPYGRVWLPTDGYGVYVVDREGMKQHLTTGDGLLSEYVREVWADTEGAMWFATLAGVNRYDPFSWRSCSLTNGVPVTSGIPGESGEMWWGTFGGGLWHYNAGKWEVWQASSGKVPTDFIQAVAYSPGAGLWIGTARLGVAWFNGKKWETFGVKDGLPNNSVNAILIAGPRDIWVGTLGGLARYTNNRWISYTSADGLPDNHVYSLAMDRDGRIWAGTSKGCAAVFDGKKWKAFTPSNSGLPASQRLQSIAVGSDNVVWFGSWGGGITSFDGKEWHRYTTEDGLPSDAVYALYLDPDNTLWAGTAGGVAYFDKKIWISYTSEGPLPDNEVRVILRDSTGRHWFGTLQGNLAIYSREKLPPQVRILYVNGHCTESGLVRVTSGRKVHISFIGGDTKTRTSDLMYLYMMKGVDGDWQWAADTNLAEYESLQPGTYTFLVRAVDEDGNYSDPPAAVQIQVLPPPTEFVVPLVKWTLPRLAGIAFMVVTGMLFLSLIYIVLSTLHRRRRVRQAIERHFNPYIAGTPIMSEDLFFGREDQLKRLLSILHYNSVMIHGERRIGKTSLLRQLAIHLRRLEDPEYFFVPVFVDLEGTPEEEFFYSLMDTILLGLDEGGFPTPPREKLTIHMKRPREYTDRDFRRDMRRTIAALQEMEPKKRLRLILLLDEIDTINGYSSRTQQQLRRLFMENFAPFVGAVVAGVGISKEWDREESPWYNLFTEMKLQPFSRADAEALIREPVRNVYEFDDDAVDFIWKHSKGKPHRIQQLCMEAVNSMLDAKRARITVDDAIQAFNHLVVTDETFREETM